jgi:hypothetical protein
MASQNSPVRVMVVPAAACQMAPTPVRAAAAQVSHHRGGPGDGQEVVLTTCAAT